MAKEPHLVGDDALMVKMLDKLELIVRRASHSPNYIGTGAQVGITLGPEPTLNALAEAIFQETKDMRNRAR